MRKHRFNSRSETNVLSPGKSSNRAVRDVGRCPYTRHQILTSLSQPHFLLSVSNSVALIALKTTKKGTLHLNLIQAGLNSSVGYLPVLSDYFLIISFPTHAQA